MEYGIGYDLSHHYEDARTRTQAVSPVFIDSVAGTAILEYAKRGKQKKKPTRHYRNPRKTKGDQLA